MDRDDALDPEPDFPQADAVALLRRIPTFAALDDTALARLAAGAERLWRADGEVLFEASETADCGYVLVSGRIALFAPRREGMRHAVLEVEPGALIGEIALIVPTPRPATAVALAPCALLRLPRAHVLPLLETDPRAAAKLRRAIAMRLEQMMKALDGVRAGLERPRPRGD